MLPVTRNSSKYFIAPFAALALTFSLAACGSDDDSGSGDDGSADGVSVTDAWVREPATGQMVSAAYGTIDVTFIFDNDAEIVAAAEVRALDTGAMDDGDMDDMEDGDMDDGDMESDG